MKRSLSIAMAMASLTALSAHAEIDFYGKANVTVELVSEGVEDYTALESNASRVGIKGSEALNDNLTAIYQLEYQVEIDDSTTFTQRNIYAGLKGGFGSVIAGHFDTPFKKSQNKVDLFDNLRGDIKNVITPNDNRASNSIMYISPELAGGLNIYVDYINSESEAAEDGKSIAVSYSVGDLYLALAADMDVEQEDSQAVRAVVQYKLGGIQLGFLAEQYEPAVGDSETGMMASIKFKMQENIDLKAQIGLSDIITAGGENISVGADYKYNSAVKVFAFYTVYGADDQAVYDNDYLGTGLEIKF